MRHYTTIPALFAIVSLGTVVGPASAEADMNAKIEAIRKRLEAERALPEEQRWGLEENQVTDLEGRAANGDAQAAQFLELARVRMAKLRRERYIQKWGRALNDPDVADELRAHARRMAQLRRVRSLAVEKGYPALVRRADDLLGAERARHDGRVAAMIQELRSGGEPQQVSRSSEQP